MLTVWEYLLSFTLKSQKYKRHCFISMPIVFIKDNTVFMLITAIYWIYLIGKCMILFHPHHNPLKLTVLLSPFNKWGKGPWKAEYLCLGSHTSKGRDRIWTWFDTKAGVCYPTYSTQQGGFKIHFQLVLKLIWFTFLISSLSSNCSHFQPMHR